MQQKSLNNTINNIFYALAGLGGVSLVIIIHELGHFLCAQFFGVPTPIFSLGFGPTLFSIPLGKTVFQVALLPFGGYVEMDPKDLAAQPYIPKMIIISAGIIVNFIFAYCIMFYYKIYNRSMLTSSLKTMLTPSFQQETSTETSQQKPTNSIIGPIGIINMLGKSLTINRQLFWLILAVVSLNIGLFNMLPLPFLDGGKALLYTIETIIGTQLPPSIIGYITAIFLALFMLLIAYVTMNDIKKLS